jgi:hypothetical protein
VRVALFIQLRMIEWVEAYFACFLCFLCFFLAAMVLTPPLQLNSTPWVLFCQRPDPAICRRRFVKIRMHRACSEGKA